MLVKLIFNLSEKKAMFNIFYYLMLPAFLLLSPIFCLFAEEKREYDESSNHRILNEIQMMQELSELTRQNLEKQLKLKILMQEYYEKQQLFLQDSRDNTLLYQLAQAAQATLKMITDNHYTSLFEPEFLSELTVMAKPASKKIIPRSSK